jgi:hypothetical protein
MHEYAGCYICPTCCRLKLFKTICTRQESKIEQTHNKFTPQNILHAQLIIISMRGENSAWCDLPGVGVALLQSGCIYIACVRNLFLFRSFFSL